MGLGGWGSPNGKGQLLREAAPPSFACGLGFLRLPAPLPPWVGLLGLRPCVDLLVVHPHAFPPVGWDAQVSTAPRPKPANNVRMGGG